MKRYTLSEMKQANKAINHYWFSLGAMRFFNTRIVSQPNKFNMFITSEQMDSNHKLGYAIRFFNEKTSEVVTVGEIQQFSTLEKAKETRQTIAKGLEQMTNREKWIMENLSNVKIENGLITFLARGEDESKKFDVSFSGYICG